MLTATCFYVLSKSFEQTTDCEFQESNAPSSDSDGDVAPIADAAESGSESSLVNPNDSDTGSDSSEPSVTKKIDVCSDDDDVGTPEPMQPDNQLGLWDWDGNPLENPPDLKDEDMATPPTPDDDLSPEEKRKQFWKRFVVPWPPLNSTTFQLRYQARNQIAQELTGPDPFTKGW